MTDILYKSEHGRLKKYGFYKQQENDKLREQATQDYLTGLYNRRGMVAETEKELRKQDRLGNQNITFAIVMFDMIGLHSINSGSGGEEEGDNKLKDISKSLLEHGRAGDIISRWGGDEFCVALINADEKMSEGYINRVVAGLPAGIRLNAAYSIFNRFNGGVESDILVVANALEEAKKMGPKDETGRSLGIRSTLRVNLPPENV